MPPGISASSSPRPGFRRWGWLALLGAVVALGAAWAAQTIGVGELMRHVILELRTMGAPIFFSAMAILPALGFPLLPFALAAGPVFSPVLGVGGVVGCAILAVSINVTLSYLLAATLFRPAVQWLLRRMGYALPDPSRQKAWFLTLLVRVAPGPPFWIQSYALGLVRVNFGAYLLVSTLVPAGYLTGAIVFGDAMMQGRPRAAMLAAGLIFLVGAGLYLLRKKIAARPSTAADAAPR